MNEAELLDRWQRERPMYEAWGEYIVATMETLLVTTIAPHKADVFVKVPPKPRLKGDASFVEKAFYRNKPYTNPYGDITDKVGVRFIVLLGSDIPKVEAAINSCSDWTASKDRDYEDERERQPMQFDYQSVHYVVRASREIPINGLIVPLATPCEIQVRTLLQHAHSELTHDTIYKPKVEATSKMRRTVAKSMALIEATNDFFEQVVADISAATQESRTLSDELTSIYRARVGKEPELTRAEGLIADAYLNQAGDDAIERVGRLLAGKPYIAGTIADRHKTHLLFRQPSMLLVYLLVTEAPNETKGNWPLTPGELRPVFGDLGMNFDSY